MGYPMGLQSFSLARIEPAADEDGDSGGLRGAGAGPI